VFMWDKRKGKKNMCKEFNCLWYGPYKIENKSRVGSFYLSTLERRRVPLPVNVSLLKTYYVEGT
jgi:hypothetical protein